MTEPEHDYQLIVIGASAGGIGALSHVVSSLPTPFPAPIVIAQHLDPKRPSRLGEILARRTQLQVRTVDDVSPLEPGTIFVVPSNHHVAITDHEVTVSLADEGAPRPSVDHLLETAAASFGEALIAVILSGMGSDGAAGARVVKSAGGMVVVQSAETATFPDMPLSLAPTTVDIVAALDAIGPLLYDLVTNAYAPTEADDDRTLRAFLDRLRERSGIDFASYKRPTIIRRLERRMAATGKARLRDYVRYVAQNEDEHRRLTSAFLIKVTEFFRDGDLFEYLRSEVLPALVDEAAEHEDELRIWSAGCASGEEAYSLAILVSEVLGERIDRLHVRIFATDLDADAIAFARRGIYPASALASLPAPFVERYFTRSDGDYEINKSVRSLMVFGQHDLGQRAPFPRIDLALCRNVLIYFTPELQKRALQLFAFSLRDSGYLVLGKAESTTSLADHFVLIQPRLKVYRRYGERVLIPPARIRDTRPMVTRLPPRSLSTEGSSSRPERQGSRLRSGGERAEALLLRLPVGVVTVDRSYDIHWINGAARILLGIHGSAIGHDFVHLAGRLPSAGLRAAIDTAFRGEAVEMEDELSPSETATGRRWVHMLFHPHQPDGPEGPTESVVITVHDATQGVTERLEQAAAFSTSQGQIRAHERQVEALAGSYGELLGANQELTTSNAELRSANEELLVANEEVQAATEEVETLNEELQATNEELETLNEELQATVEELNTTNDDLQARGLELQEVADTLTLQRAEADLARLRMEAAVDALRVAMLFVDRDGAVLHASARWDAEVERGSLEDEDGRALDGPRRLGLRAIEGDWDELPVRLRRDGAEPVAMLARFGPIRHGDEVAGGIVWLERRAAGD